MRKIFAPLAELDFGRVLNEAQSSTATGEALLNKYRAVMLNNESTCGLVNNFIKEAQQALYDNGVSEALNRVMDVVDANITSWKLASVCEQVRANNSKYNFLNRNAADQVSDLLEGKNEEEVVKYIKAGALKNIMFCESFRSVVRDVYKSQAQHVVEEKYESTQPISYVEESDGNIYFEIKGSIYKINENKIEEASANEVSKDFLMISRLIESPMTKVDENSITIDLPAATYVISECGECANCKRKSKKAGEVKEELTFEDVDALREHNRLVTSATAPQVASRQAEVLEAIARCFEHYNNFAIISHAKIVTTPKDTFVVIENHDTIYAKCLHSNHTNAWSINSNVVESLDFIKNKTGIDLKSTYAANIQEAFENREEEEKKQIKESIEKAEVEARKLKIEQLTEQFKEDPAKLAVLSTIAAELNKI